MLYHGPVRVPNNAMPGKAIVRVQLSEESEFRSLPTDIEIVLVKEQSEDESSNEVRRSR